MDNENTQVQPDSGPPPTEASKKPHNLEAVLGAMDPATQELVRKVIVDNENYKSHLKSANERVAKTESKLNELVTKEQEAERTRLEEQGKWKELAEKSQAELQQLRQEVTERKRREAVSRELSKAGVIDDELVAEGLLAKYKDEMTPDNLPDFVARLKADKPLLFKAEQSAPQPDTQPVVQPPAAPVSRSTGLPTGTPHGSSAPSPFDARNKKVPISEVERLFTEATKNAQW